MRLDFFTNDYSLTKYARRDFVQLMKKQKEVAMHWAASRFI